MNKKIGEDILTYLYDVPRDKIIETIRKLKLEEEVTPVIATYNRPKSLEWTVDNILNGYVVKETEIIKEIIIVDDCSTVPDFKTIVNKLKNKYSSKIRVIELKKRVFPFKAWDIGISKATSKYLLIMTDDVLLNMNWPIRLVITENLEKMGIKIGALMGPSYLRTTVPDGVVPIKKIGAFNPLEITSNFNSFPLEYLEQRPYFNKELKILTPIRVFNLAGNIIVTKSCVERVRGFNRNNVIEVNYGGETNLARKLVEIDENGFIPALYSPGPSSAEIHLKVGYKRDLEEGDLSFARYYGLSPEEVRSMIEYSNKTDYNTGSRRRPHAWMYLRWRNFSRISLKKSVPYFIIHGCRVFYDALQDNTRYYRGKTQILSRLNIASKSVKNALFGYERPLNEIIGN